MRNVAATGLAWLLSVVTAVWSLLVGQAAASMAAAFMAVIFAYKLGKQIGD